MIVFVIFSLSILNVEAKLALYMKSDKALESTHIELINVFVVIL